MAEKIDSNSIQCGFESHLPHFSPGVRVYGPYWSQTNRSINRRFVILVFPDGTKKTTAFARYVMEQKLGSFLPKNYEVDHIDEDPLNDNVENLRVLLKRDNILQSITPEEYYYFDCPVCKEPSKKLARNVRGNKKKGHAGPFCSRQCARKFQILSRGT